ncbi:CBS domain-containing protein [Phycicoccus flavus]|uniref:CBS domain-containing protein n=1 Tax=Phycicoccus flavus TaxID=2502783 RepID=UPI000FEBDF90|nr:CBS domain-containing protein [Phycicoccus flavus]NHA69785.1 CBS domain-containing protein [Phycicoccus flavus]
MTPTRPRTVADVMLSTPKTHGPDATAGDLRALFRDDHVHVALVVDAGRLLAVVDRDDVCTAPDDTPAAACGAGAERSVTPGEDVEVLRRRMREQGSRRYAVVDEDGMLLGLLCLKRSGRGFCSDADVADRAAERRCAG